MNEYCDQGQCPARARVQIRTGNGPLYLCQHHFRHHCDALERLAVDVCDLQTGLPALPDRPARAGGPYRSAKSGTSCGEAAA